MTESAWWGEGGCESCPDTCDSRGCCTCNESPQLQPQDLTVSPIETARTCEERDEGRLCEMTLVCPSGSTLSEQRGFCSDGTECDVLGPKFLSESTLEFSYDCWRYMEWNGHYLKCRTCVPGQPSTTLGPASSIPGALPTTSSAPSLGTTTTSSGREWELVSQSEGRACRGNDRNDNSPTYYDVRSAGTLEACQDMCLEQLISCKGIEYNSGTGRCEIWHREAGIHAWAISQDFTCMRFGWSSRYLASMPAHRDQACRGETAADNSDSYYAVQEVMHMNDCVARCVAAPICFGIEFSGKRCEIWTRPILATASVAGFTCLRYEPFKPIDGSRDRACRGESASDSSPTYYELHKGVSYIDDCKARCIKAPTCFGIEFSPYRCEIWIRPIQASASKQKFTCYRYEGPRAASFSQAQKTILP